MLIGNNSQYLLDPSGSLASGLQMLTEGKTKEQTLLSKGCAKPAEEVVKPKAVWKLRGGQKMSGCENKQRMKTLFSSMYIKRPHI